MSSIPGGDNICIISVYRLSTVVEPKVRVCSHRPIHKMTVSSWLLPKRLPIYWFRQLFILCIQWYAVVTRCLFIWGQGPQKPSRN